MVKNFFQRGLEGSKILKQGAAALKNTKQLPGSVISTAGLPPAKMMDGLNQVIHEVTEYLKLAELEETKRAEISARRDVAIESIRSQRELISEFLEYTFAERAQVISKHFEALDHALASGNVAVADAALKGMVGVIQSSPFKFLQDMQTAMRDKNFTMRLE